MQKSEFKKIRIDVHSQQNGEDVSVLSIMLSNDGTILRQGSGMLPADQALVEMNDNGTCFEKLIELLDEDVLPHASVYDHPNKQGTPIHYSIAFFISETESVFFEFMLGTETTDVGNLLPYFDHYITEAIQLTEPLYRKQLLELVNKH